MAYGFTAASNQYLLSSPPITSVPLTMVCWFNLTNVGTLGRLIHLGFGGGEKWHTMYHNSSQLWTSSYSDGTGGQSNRTLTSLSNTWTHGASVFSANNNRLSYVNGTAGSVNATTVNVSNIDTLSIGSGFFSSASNSPINGRMCEVGIWSDALTAAEIASLAKGMTCDKIRPQSLVFYAPLVRNLQDVKGGRTITNNNGAIVATHPRVYA